MQTLDKSQKPQGLSKQILSSYKPTSQKIETIKKTIEDHSHFILTTHINSDPDGVGSELAFAALLKSLGKEVEIINNELPEQSLSFLSGFENIQTIDKLVEAHGSEKILEKFQRSCVILLDSSELKRSALVGEFLQRSKSDWITIDHHELPANEHYCNDASYASTTEFVWDIYHALEVELDADVAQALYVGMVADSGNFRYSKTSSRTHFAAAELLDFSVSSEHVYRSLFESFPFDRLLLIKKIFAHAHYNKKWGFVFAQLKPKFKKELELGEKPSEGIVNFFLAVNGVNIAALASKTDEGFLKCSLRSIDDYDVSFIARKFGGGGHKNASGLLIEKKYSKAKKMLLKEIRKYLKKKQNTA